MAMDGLLEGVSRPDLETAAAAEQRGVRENQIRLRGFYPEG